MTINLDNYKPFLIQKMKDGYLVKDSSDWGVLVKSFPFKLSAEPKDIPSNNWMDEDGDDEFVPDFPVYKAYTEDVEFLYIGDYNTAVTKINEFISYLATQGLNKIYDSYTQIGRKDVRYVGSKEAKLIRNKYQGDIVIFKLTFKFNDPKTQIELVK